VFGLIVSGYLGQSLGWQYIFFFSGALGIIWFLFWAMFTSDSPATRGAIHQLLSIILKLRILVLLPVSTMPYVVMVKNYS
jgi:predicted MFS family arabinose efflux permease